MRGPRALIVATSASDRAADLLIGARSGELLPIGNSTILEHVLESIRRAGIGDVVIAIDGLTGHEIRSAVGDGRQLEMRITYVERHEPFGAARAILATEEFLTGAPFVLHIGSGIVRAPLAPLVRQVLQTPLDALLLVAPQQGSGRRAASGVAAAGVQVLGEAIFACLHDLRPSWRGDIELDEAIEKLRARGGRVEERETSHWWSYDGTADSLLKGNRLALDDIVAADLSESVLDSDVSGNVNVHPTAVVRSSVLRGPALIGAGARISDAYVGPYTSIGDRVVIQGAEIEDSIVLPGAVIRYLGERLQRSVLGRNAKLSREFTVPKAFRLVVGDGAEIALT